MPRLGPTLFGRIARHPVGVGRDAREDRLTEVVAAVLDSPSCKGLARHVAMAWLGDAREHHGAIAKRGRFSRLHDRLADDGQAWNCEIKTQRSLRTMEGQLRRPDLTLRFTAARAQTLTLVIEVKHGSAPHTDQLRAYVDHHSGTDHAAVLLLAPRSDLAWLEPAQIPAEVARIRWQDTARAIDDWATGDPVAQFLVDELTNYLNEEGLVDPSQITAEDISALIHHQRALDALDRLCELAADDVAQRWAALLETGAYPTRGQPKERWWSYPARRADDVPLRAQQLLEHWGWGWQLIYDSSYLFDDGGAWVPRLGAGMTAALGSIQDLTQDEQERLRERGFELLSRGSTRSQNWDYVWRMAELDGGEVLTGGRLDEQAELLACWVVDTFAGLADAL